MLTTPLKTTCCLTRTVISETEVSAVVSHPPTDYDVVWETVNLTSTHKSWCGMGNCQSHIHPQIMMWYGKLSISHPPTNHDVVWETVNLTSTHKSWCGMGNCQSHIHPQIMMWYGKLSISHPPTNHDVVWETVESDILLLCHWGWNELWQA